MEANILQKILSELLYLKKVKNQSAFCDLLKYDKGYISNMLKSADTIPPKLQSKLHNVFGVSMLWLATNGKEGSMFETDTTPKPSTPKEVILLGKHTANRLTSEQYAASFGDWKGVPMYNNPVTASFVEAILSY